MQLVAYGAQDIYLTGNPQITFFKVVYRRHTNFAMEAIEQVFTGQADFGKKVSCTISRNGDLINHVYLQMELPALSKGTVVGSAAAPGLNSVGWTNAVGHAVIKVMEVEIGGQRIDKQYGTWLEIWDELTQVAEKTMGYGHMVGKFATDLSLQDSALIPHTYYVPLQFWFCRNPGLSLPLIALQYHEVKINMEFRPLGEVVVALDGAGNRYTTQNYTSLAAAGTTNMISCSLFVDYIYLDTDERRRFAQMSHEYLIDQLQFQGSENIQLQGAENVQQKTRMNFNHPVKELVWTLQRTQNNTAGTMYNDWFNFSMGAAGQAGGDILGRATILLNGHERFQMRLASYFRLVQPYQHHTRIPAKHIYVYSFGLRPEEHQPSGTCNFSRIDNSQLVYQVSAAASALTGQNDQNGQLALYATNYNVLRVMSGMGGLAYSN